MHPLSPLSAGLSPLNQAFFPHGLRASFLACDGRDTHPARQAAASALIGTMFAILHHEWVHYVADIPCQFLASRERGWAAGSSNITFVIISSARNTGLASATPRWTACLALSRTGRRGKERHDPQLLFLKQGRPGASKSGIIKWRGRPWWRFTAPMEMGRGQRDAKWPRSGGWR